MSKVPARGTQIALGIQSGISLPHKIKSNKLHGHEGVDTAGMRDKGYGSYRGRSHGRAETGANPLPQPEEVGCRRGQSMDVGEWEKRLLAKSPLAQSGQEPYHLNVSKVLDISVIWNVTCQQMCKLWNRPVPNGRWCGRSAIQLMDSLLPDRFVLEQKKALLGENTFGV